MKFMKKTMILCMTAAAMLTMTACQAKPAATAQNEEEINSQIDELLDERTAVMEEHQDLWDTVFTVWKNSENDDVSMEEDGKTYYLSMIEEAKDLLTEEEIETLKKDADRICALDEQLGNLFDQLETSGADAAEQGPELAGLSRFPNFSATDFDGNEVDESIFSEHAVTLVNFWFNECSPCVEEIPTLHALNQEMAEKGGAVLGINADGASGQDMVAAAKEILNAQHADYQNLYFAPETDAGKLVSSIQAFPTSLLIDRNGNVVGEPILGSIESEEMLKQVKERMEAVIQADQGNA